ncbi:hypothetical protein [Thermoplasma sp. Kam2015]|uniref:hypothetical protein n=1 Tax=Thermoplasma sp. Kam2015 TaxID=2094122 RepID=UPI001292F4CF|nr:hypothetical protein [Thermoplasma sp. Kam2015]
MHLSGEQRRNAILRAYGLIKEDRKIDAQVKTCPGCGNEIRVDAEYCQLCYVEFPNRSMLTI